MSFMNTPALKPVPTALEKASLAAKRLASVPALVNGRRAALSRSTSVKTRFSNARFHTWAAFAGTEENAVVDGDFAVSESELQPVLKALRAAATVRNSVRSSCCASPDEAASADS